MEVLGPTEFIMVVLLTLTVFCMTDCSQHLDNLDDLNFREVIVRRRSDCNETIVMDLSVPGYTVISNLKRYECSRKERGFKCHTTFQVQDPFELLGFQLCADLQGVENAFTHECQLSVDVTSPGSDILKGVYCNSRLTSPSYTCVRGSTLQLTYGTQPTVRVCPTILNYLFNNNFSVGSVLLRQETPVYNVHLGMCVENELPDEDEFIVKVYPPGYDPSQCPRYDRSIISLMESKMRGCLSLVYMSDSFHYSCTIDVVLKARRSSKELKLEVRRTFRDLPQETQATICKDFDYENDGDVVLDISTRDISACSGKVAVKVSFSPLTGEDPDDSSQLNSPRVFMAVFIALIIICLICLALTCLCCIRFRTKRLRNARRRRHQGAPTTNEAFDDLSAPGPAYDGSSISWSQSNPGMIFGLPSYEDVTGERPAGVNPVSDRAHKDDLPPSYDSIFAQETSGN